METSEKKYKKHYRYRIANQYFHYINNDIF